MTLYLAYSYSVCLTEKEQSKIDEKVNKNQAEFRRGFLRGIQISLSIYSVYSLITAASYAADSCPDPGQIPLPADTEAVPASKPGFKPLSEGIKGAFVGAASVICGTALQSGDFFIGVACAILLVIGGIVINRPNN